MTVSKHSPPQLLQSTVDDRRPPTVRQARNPHSPVAPRSVLSSE